MFHIKNQAHGFSDCPLPKLFFLPRGSGLQLGCSRYEIIQLLQVYSLWVAIWLSDPEAQVLKDFLDDVLVLNDNYR